VAGFVALSLGAVWVLTRQAFSGAVARGQGAA
jgi:hypothetical protein